MRNTITIKTALLTLAMAFPAGMCAQSADWLVLPKYEDIQVFAPQLYKVTKDGKQGVMTTSGQIVIPTEYDYIGDFYEGRAIICDYTSNSMELKGVVDENGAVSFVRDRYYVLDYYPFYSEGYIPVMDRDGLYGYLDGQCHPAFEFTENETNPFSEGMAAVGDGDDFHWLTTSGEKWVVQLKNGGYPHRGTNFYNGTAYIQDEEGNCFILDDTGRSKKLPSMDSFDIDYLYRMNEDTGKGLNVEYSYYSHSRDNTWQPKERNGLWSFVNYDGKLLAPFQYDRVEYFCDGSARAMSDGKWGLLKVVEDESTFYTKADKKRHIFSSDKGCECSFTLSVPDKWKGESLSVILKDAESGEKITLRRESGNVFSFSYKPDDRESKLRKRFQVEVNNDDITLWRGEEEYDFAQRTKLVASLRVNNADANSDDRCIVTAMIKNPSSIPVTTTVTLSGGGNKASFNNKTVTLTIPAHSVKTVSSAFVVNKVELNGWCAVTTGDGSSARRSNLELKPF